MPRIGIMQGRLVPPEGDAIQCFPREAWAREFELAARAGLDSIEWIYDAHGADVNPIATDSGIERIRELIAESGVDVLSVCADYFMDAPLLRVGAETLAERLDTLFWLMRRAQLLGTNRMVMPFVDASRIETAGEVDQVVDIMLRALPVAEETGVELHLETSLGPAAFAELLGRIDHPLLKANYDSGNSSGLGYRPRDEFAAYGSRVGSVHIKDRVLGGTTVALGTGDADFASLFDCLHEVGYHGDFILQVARDASGDEVAWSRANRGFVLARLADHDRSKGGPG
jgi:L-ribulose-5-phosphate 3-epimerase